MEVLQGTKDIIRGGYRVEPVLYSQSGSLSNGSVYFTDFTVSASLSDGVNSIDDQTALIYHSGSELFPPTLFPLDNSQEVTSTFEKIFFKPEIYDSGNNFNPGTFSYVIPSSAVQDGIYLQFSVAVQLISLNSVNRNVNITLHKNGNPSTLPGAVEIFDTGGASGTAGIEGVVYLKVTIPPNELSTGDVYDVRIKGDSGLYVVTENNLQWDNIATNPTPRFFLNQTANQDLEFLNSLLGTYLNPSYWRVTQDPISSGGTITVGTDLVWGYPSTDLSVITCSSNVLNRSYEKVSQVQIPDSGFSKTSLVFSVIPGDEFRFEDIETNVYEVQSVIPPYDHPSGTLEIKFQDPIASASINLDHFLHRRYVEDGSFIIFDSSKPAGSSGTSIIKPQFVTTPLQKDAESFTLLLSERGLITDS